MKKILSLIGVAALLATVSVNAQTYSPQTISLAGINGGAIAVATGTNTLFATNYTSVATMPTIGTIKQRYLSVSETHFNLDANGTTNQYIFIPSVDGVGYSTNSADYQSFSNVITGAAGAAGTKTFTFDTFGYGYYKLAKVVTSSGVSTNSSMSYGVKMSAP